jgi:hypothetical protein
VKFVNRLTSTRAMFIIIANIVSLTPGSTLSISLLSSMISVMRLIESDDPKLLLANSYMWQKSLLTKDLDLSMF